MDKTAELLIEGKKYKLPVIEGTEQERGLDISELRNQSGYVTLDDGYANTGSCQSSITFIDGEKGILRYRGIPIEELAEKSTFIEVAHLIIFGKLPKARLCFDIGHAHEIDRSMSLGYEILRRFRDRIAHVHASEVSDDCQHGPFTASSYAAFAKITNMIPESAPVILETDVPENRVENQLKEARGLFGHSDSKRANGKQPRGGDRIQRSLR